MADWNARTVRVKLLEVVGNTVQDKGGIVEPTGVSMDTSFTDFGMDSLKSVETMAVVSETFDDCFELDELGEVQTINELYRFVLEKLGLEFEPWTDFEEIDRVLQRPLARQDLEKLVLMIRTVFHWHAADVNSATLLGAGKAALGISIRDEMRVTMGVGATDAWKTVGDVANYVVNNRE